jgi:hypothetical protein
VLKLTGEQFDPRRHLMLTELKAVTYHQLNLARAGGEWKARIVFRRLNLPGPLRSRPVRTESCFGFPHQ